MLRFLGFIALLATLLLVIGLFAGWFSFFDAESGNRQDVTMRIDKKEIEEDLESVKREVDEALESDPEQRIRGDLVAADAAMLRIEVRSVDRGTLRLEVATDAAITLDGEKARLAELRAGDRVVVRLEEQTRQATHVDAVRVD